MPGDGSDFPLGGLKIGDMAQQIRLQQEGNKLKELGSANKMAGNGTLGRVAKPKQAEEAATQFEAFLLHQMLKTMWESVPKEQGMLSGSFEEGIYRDMLSEGVAADIAKNQSLGIKRILIKEFEKQGGGSK